MQPAKRLWCNGGDCGARNWADSRQNFDTTTAEKMCPLQKFASNLSSFLPICFVYLRCFQGNVLLFCWFEMFSRRAVVSKSTQSGSGRELDHLCSWNFPPKVFRDNSFCHDCFRYRNEWFQTREPTSSHWTGLQMVFFYFNSETRNGGKFFVLSVSSESTMESNSNYTASRWHWFCDLKSEIITCFRNMNFRRKFLRSTTVLLGIMVLACPPPIDSFFQNGQLSISTFISWNHSRQGKESFLAEFSIRWALVRYREPTTCSTEPPVEAFSFQDSRNGKQNHQALVQPLHMQSISLYIYALCLTSGVVDFTRRMWARV